MRVTLHIGAHKTGTSSVQAFLRRNIGAFAAHGLDVVTLNNSINLSNLFYFHNNDAGEPQFGLHPHMLDTLMDTLSQSGHDKLISSEDFFFVHDREALAPLAERLSALTDDIRIVVYLRNQIDLAVSNKAQGAKTSQSALFFGNDAAHVLPELTPAVVQYLTFSDKLEMWRTLFPNAEFIVKSYEQNGGDSVRDFVETLDLPLPAEVIKANESLGSKLTNFLHNLRHHGLEPQKAWFLFSMGAFFDDGGLRQRPSAAQARAFMAAFEADNQKIKETYGVEVAANFDKFGEHEEIQPDDRAFVYRNVANVLNATVTETSNAEINTLRDAAVALQGKDLKLAHDLMRMAHERRPEGTFIAKKLENYRRRLEKQAGK